jgi:hypothetical protein
MLQRVTEPTIAQSALRSTSQGCRGIALALAHGPDGTGRPERHYAALDPGRSISCIAGLVAVRARGRPLLIGLVADEDRLFSTAGRGLARLARNGGVTFARAVVLVATVTAVLLVERPACQCWRTSICHIGKPPPSHPLLLLKLTTDRLYGGRWALDQAVMGPSPRRASYRVTLSAGESIMHCTD